MAAIVAACNFSNHADLGYRVYTALFAVQHRGEHNASLTAIRQDGITHKRKHGLLERVFVETDWTSFDGQVVLGRIGCQYPEAIVNPIFNYNKNAAAVYEGQLSASPKQVLRDPENAISLAVSYIKNHPGAYGMTIGLPGKLLACCDPRGIRHLAIGRFEDGSYILATESASIEAAGAVIIGSIQPGRLVILTSTGLQVEPVIDYFRKRRCVAEVSSRMMPTSEWLAATVAGWRKELSQLLAERFSHRVEAVIPIPRAAIIGAQAFASAVGVPYRPALVYNRYIHNNQTVNGVDPIDLKFGIIESELVGLQSVALVDDMVRSGKTMAGIAKRLRGRGIRLIHGVVLNPLLVGRCDYGIANWPAGGLLENGNPSEVCAALNLDSLTAIGLEDLYRVFGSEICCHCFGGEKPFAFPANIYRPQLTTP